MSEWKRHRGSKSMPKCLEGKKFEVRHRDGSIATCDGIGEWYWDHRGNDWDIFAYRILPSEPAAEPAKPDYSKGFPVGTTAKDIGAKVGDEFVVVNGDGVGYENGSIIKLAEDDGTNCPYFSNTGKIIEGERFECMYWHELAPIPQKTAIELQAEEVGIPEPVRLVDDDTHLGIKRPDGDGWVKYNAGDVVDLDGVVSIDWVNACGDRVTAHYPKWLMCGDGSKYQIAWYRLNYGDASHQDYTSGSAGGEKARETLARLVADGVIDPQKVVRREDVNIGPKSEREPTTATQFLQSALSTLTQRGKDYDKPEGERSAAAVAMAFNAITGRDMTEAEVWLVLQLVKDVRQWQNPERYHADSALDCVAYAALKAEALASGSK